ncbi:MULTISPECIES: PolC-type DNA polymerase III [unclassified Mycoplasma]|uniref:PolC-type DNA polymerase III n=1 Tax=unclassified Mycoplasma TaxID=2683645 RepID=UPI00211BA539|nr:MULTISPECIES: PolC-type DNA polymerase III [unclassified Mycoplasma]UUM19805.1 PolC-type DNA polymerase III [Mycoplasma sp. 1578d]UUM24789.1 PolC-type DNA polymerase III [Mycoplasma sp. 3686d]
MKTKDFYKDISFNNFAKYSNLGELESIQDAYILNNQIEFSDDKKNAFLTICFKNIPSFSDFILLKHKIDNFKDLKLHVDFLIDNYYPEDPKIKDYALYFLSLEPKFEEIVKAHQNSSFLQINHEKRKWVFMQIETAYEELLNEIIFYLKDQFAKINLNKVDFEIEIVKIELPKLFASENFILEQEQKLLQINEQVNSVFGKSVYNAKKNKFNSNKANYQLMNIKDIHSIIEIPQQFNVAIKGQVYKTDFIDRKNFIIYKYWISDLKDAIEVSYFQKEKLSDDGIFSINDWIEVYGSLGESFDKSQKIIKANKIIKTESPLMDPVDNEPIKRIELNAKTKMNTMDGIMSPTQLVEFAQKLGHKAVAICDLNGVQAFPEFYQATKSAKIKPIYGASFNIIDKNNKVFLNSFENFNLDDIEYVAFDLETTNLSASFGEIIEFGGVIIKNKRIIEEFQFFLKPNTSISSFTTNLTSITNQMLQEQGLEQIDGLNKIYNILNNRYAIAHNCNFDMGFIYQKFSEYNIPIPNTTFMDALAISRLLFPWKRRHTLGAFCSYLSIDYKEDEAHRADYDARVLANVWMAAIEELKKSNIYTCNDLSSLITDGYYSNVRADEMSVLVLNQQGLKELFQFVTLALTKRYFGRAKLFYDDLVKSPNLLFGSGGIRSGLIDAYLFGSQYQQQKLLKLFDYIEVPHPSAFLNNVGENDLTLQQIQVALKKLIQDATKLGKIVIAISDARYEKDQDQIFYKSLVYSMGIGGTPHFLFNKSKAQVGNLVIPKLHFLTTREMLDQFAFLGDLQMIKDVVINNTHKIEKMVANDIQVIKKDLYTPKFDNSHQKLYDLVYKTAREKYGENLPPIIEERLEKEIQPIIKYGYDVIYWISNRLIKKCEDMGSIAGSRGSVGSSLVATMAGITEVNPLPPHYICPKCKHFEVFENSEITSGYDLDDKKCPKCNIIMDKDGHSIPFETFLGFNADKVPDIDLNFSGDYQSEIHNEVKRIFGEENTLRAGTISTIKEKTAFGYIKKIEEEYNFGYSRNFIDFLSSKIIGVKRTTGQHPGGIIIIPKEFQVEDFTPTNYPADDISIDWKTTHFDFHAIHDNVLKLDILGHRDPTAILMLQRITNINFQRDIPKKDPRVMSLFTSTKELNIDPSQIGGEQTGAIGLPEFGTSFVRKMLKEAKPTSFADLISISGLSHGTDVWANNAQTLIKNNSFTLRDVICCRDDILYYLKGKGVDALESFKIMEKVRKGKGLTDEEASKLEGQNIPSWYIDSMQKIKYMFPKAHAAAYVLMAWRIAWFKLYYPLEYYATFLTIRVEEFDIETIVNDHGALRTNKKINEINKLPKKTVLDDALLTTLESVRELYARGFSINNINLEKSLEKEWVIDKNNKALIPPFSAVKGLGESVAKKIIQARNEREFISKEDFAKRTSINKTLLDTLNNLGVLNTLDDTDQMKLF